MKKTITYLSVCCLFIVNSSFILADSNSAAGASDSTSTLPVIIHPVSDMEMEINSLYSSLCLEEKGLSKNAFAAAYKGYRKLVKRNVIDNPRYLTICDFSQSSKLKRFYLIDMDENQVLYNTYVAHGRNSGHEYATRFSNKPSSLQSSLGFYETANTYVGEHGLSLRVKGLEKGINDKAYQRAIVIHGADYIEESRLRELKSMGRSFGCPAVPKSESKEIIQTIKDGTLLFIYHPSRNYQLKSKILNG